MQSRDESVIRIRARARERAAERQCAGDSGREERLWQKKAIQLAKKRATKERATKGKCNNLKHTTTHSNTLQQKAIERARERAAVRQMREREREREHWK